MSDQERRIVVEIFSHEEADRLRDEMKQMDERYSVMFQRLEREISGLHSTLYECMEIIGSLRRKR